MLSLDVLRALACQQGGMWLTRAERSVRLQEFPSIRFRASKPVGDEAGSGLETQALVSQRVALELDERLRHFQQAGQLPSAQTCDLIIVDRSAAPFSGPCHLSRAPFCTHVA